MVSPANGTPVGAPKALCLSALDLVRSGEVSGDWFASISPRFAALGSPDYGSELLAGTPWAPAAAEPDVACLGAYRNDFYGAAEVATVDGHLVLRLGPKPPEFALTPDSRDTFTWQPAGENA